MKKSLILIAATSSLTLFAQEKKPNIIIVCVDDMGYSDPGCFGGEIHTPNIDQLAQNGLRMTQFYNCSRSCPSRASMLTGLYAQEAGITAMGQSLSQNCVTIPEVLKQYGYNTGMTGKWHLSETKSQKTYQDQMNWLAHRADFGPFAPLSSYPCNRGFDEHYGIIWGVADYFDPFSLVHNEEPIRNVPPDFYMTDFVTDKTLDLIDTFSGENKPFFLYVAYTAPHWPLQAKQSDIRKYKGKYKEGWDVIRQNRYNKMLKMGLFDPKQLPVSQNESGKLWADEPDKAYEASAMEVHAAMLDCVDQGVGKIIKELKAKGQYENTVIFFLSDNGASPERYNESGFDRPSMTRNGDKVFYPFEKPQPGLETSEAGIGEAWAGALNTPFRYWKSESFHGGNATPMIIQWPAGMKMKKGSISQQPAHITELMPTCLQLAGAQYPADYKGNTIKPLIAKSFLPVLQNDTSYRSDVMYWEHEGGRAVRKGNWKLVSLKNAEWQLFDLSVDLSETTNVIRNHPEVASELKQLWNVWAAKMNLKIPAE